MTTELDVPRHPHHYGSQPKVFLALNEHRTTRTRRVGIAIGEPEVLISRQQVAAKVTGQRVPSISGIRCMHERNVGALNRGTIEFQGSNVIEIVLQHDEHHISQKGASRNLLRR